MPALTKSNATTVNKHSPFSNKSLPKKIVVQEFRDIKELIKYFYPGESVLPRLVIYKSDIADIMNCSPVAAGKLMGELRQSLGRERWQPVLTREFCAFMDLDYYLIQLFLLSRYN